MTIDELISRNVDEIIVKESFLQKLQNGQKLRIKMGFDPTKPDLHLGHMVGIRLLKKLQDDGHTIIFIIGDYTTKIGDPSGRNSTRPVLTDEEIKQNAQTYFEQVGRVLDISKAEIKNNSEWLNKLNFADLIKLCGNFTVANIIEREDFQKRIADKSDIGMHELLYPMMQAYDSVEVKAEVEFGGTDQKLNMLAGRDLQKKMGQTPQDVVTTKLLIGLDGKNKMSKSLNNYIAITDTANEMYGKVMSIPDDLIVQYFTLCTNVSEEAIKTIEQELVDETRNPRDIKAELAKLITELYYDAQKAEEAENEFNQIFRDKGQPTDITEKKVEIQECRLDDLLLKCELVNSKSEAQRLITQGGVSVEGERISDPQKVIAVKAEMIVQVGKRRFIKIKKAGI